MSPKGFLGGLSWLQLVAGALAAMTSAWVASFLGVAGTIIGAALGSLVASIASALYARGLDRGTTLITESGSVVARARPSGEGGEDVDVAVTREQTVVSVDEAERAFPWKRVLTWSGLALAVSLLAIGGYELVTGDSFGKADNPTIGRPWKDQSSTPKSPTEGRTNGPADSTEPTGEPDDGPTNTPSAPARPEPTQPAPTTEAPNDSVPEPELEQTPPPAGQQAPQAVPE
ncbi:hypothetical protein [Aeromicrobium duanguangcaii]|uniref:Uncharacterized protein n=1 Tax=Aeromicrobium duanguangcaii TaxID=2968086 RepID=A0ABY5KKX4_9ACTN|nr:hypothetical protein [Aeromicrobium duanguangcaii]MCD9153173.1 hypothetical protein [Aeromicrobium duanguangcaii]UUI69726.1 hypothetical protein NP095_06425 [Aeromicrobium duanguangcaii]